MAEPIISLALETLGNLLLEEARFLAGVGKQVKKIQEQLRTMMDFLKDADEKQQKEEAVRTWVKQVRNLACRTENVLETYAIDVASKRGRGIKNVLNRYACILSEGISLHKVGKEIENISSGITELERSRQSYGIEDINKGESSDHNRRLLKHAYAHEVEEHFVGMEEDIRQLVSLITDDKRDLQVISIWGIGGLGKTALARKIFNHRDVKKSFDSFAWVSITQEFKIDKVLQDILHQILEKNMHDDQTDLVRKQGIQTDLASELYKSLKEKKCLIVLDDVPKVVDWKIPMGELRSKILLTTRDESVASGFPHKLRYLTEEESWELLQNKAFTKDLQIQRAFEHIGKEIVRKCGYYPPAISEIGEILRDKRSLSEWKLVNKEINLCIRREGNEEALGSVRNVLASMYDELPYYLKPCFLYMGNLRENETIDAEKLYQLWIAEGLVLSENCGEEETMIDVAERYLNELGSRGMVEVQIEDISLPQRFRSCQLNILMRDLCLAKGKEEEIFKIIYLDDGELPILDSSSQSHKGHRLGINIQSEEYRPIEARSLKLFDQVKGQHIRTLFFHGQDLLASVLQDIYNLKKFKLLRVLHLEYCKCKLSEEISQLIHLRYVSLRGSNVEELPSSISNLPLLQSLDLRTSVDIGLPKKFWKMKRLKYLYLPSVIRGFENLKFNCLHELEILHGFRCSVDGPTDLSQLVNLRSFSGSLDTHVSGIIDQFNYWRKIKWIKLEMFGSDLMSDHGSALVRKVLLFEKLNSLEILSPIGKFPPYEPHFGLNLLQLRIENAKIGDDPMQLLKKLLHLRSLDLSKDAFVGKEMVCEAMTFLELRYLRLHNLPNLEKWRVDASAMPNLSHVIISECHKLEMITDGLNFSTLKEFDISLMPEEFKQKYEILYDQERKKFHKLQRQNS